MKKPRLIELAERDLSEVQDNLARARSAALRVDPLKNWGESGRTLAEIIAGYEEWEQEAKREQAKEVCR